MIRDKQLNELIDLLLNIKTKDDMKNFLLGILTSKELEEISNRLSIIKMLKRGISQHKVAEKLRVGIATVTRGSKELQKGRFRVV